MADQGDVDFSRLGILREALPDLQSTISPYDSEGTKEWTMSVNIREGTVTPQESVIIKTGDPTIDVQGVVRVQNGRIRLRIALRSTGKRIVETPAKISWEVSLESNRVSQEIGKKSRFLKVPMQYLTSQSDDFLEMRLDDLRNGIINNDCVLCKWKVNLEWFREENIEETSQRSVLALHHIADMMETFEENFRLQQKQQREMQESQEELRIQQREPVDQP